MLQKLDIKRQWLCDRLKGFFKKISSIAINPPHVPHNSTITTPLTPSMSCFSFFHNPSTGQPPPPRPPPPTCPAELSACSEG